MIAFIQKLNSIFPNSLLLEDYFALVNEKLEPFNLHDSDTVVYLAKTSSSHPIIDLAEKEISTYWSDITYDSEQQNTKKQILLNYPSISIDEQGNLMNLANIGINDDEVQYDILIQTKVKALMQRTLDEMQSDTAEHEQKGIDYAIFIGVAISGPNGSTFICPYTSYAVAQKFHCMPTDIALEDQFEY